MMMMRRMAMAAAAAACMILLGACHPGEKKPAAARPERLVIPSVLVQIEVQPEAQQVGKRVTLAVGMTNTGSEGMKYDETASLADWEISLTNAAAEKVALTEAGQAAKEKGKGFFGMQRTLEPGKRAETRFELQKLFDLSQPGTYRVTVKRLFRNRQGQVMSKAISNTVEFSLVGA